MSLKAGTVVTLTRDAPIGNVYKGTVGIIDKDFGRRYLMHILGDQTQGCFWIPVDYVKEYHYKSGDRVEIISPKSKYKGYYATVYEEYYGYGCCSRSVRLFVDGTNYQPSENHNYLTLVKTSVKPLCMNNKGENNMKTKLTGFNKVAIIEHRGMNLHYALYDEDIMVGDKVLVSGVLSTNMQTVKNVITLDESKEAYSGEIYEEVKCKIDLSSYNQRVKNRAEADKLRKKMDEEIKKMDELHKYEMYAANNPALKEMLEQFRTLSGN